MKNLISCDKPTIAALADRLKRANITHLVTPSNPLKLALSLACSRFIARQLPEIG